MKRMNLQLIGLAMLLFWAVSANAVPSFSRKTQMPCAGCHSAYPQLNSTGRIYKELGYRFASEAGAGDEQISDDLRLEQHVPLSAVIVARPYDKKDSGETKVRALHEIEVIVAGSFGQQWSGFFEFEAEDETNFELEVPISALNWNIQREVNIQLAYASLFFADPYGIIGDHFRLTRGHVKPIDERFGGNDSNGRLRDRHQQVGVNGRFGTNTSFFYNAGIAGLSGDPEGEEAETLFWEAAMDFAKQWMVGVFGVNGSDQTTNLDFERVGLQGMWQGANATIQGVWISASDDLPIAAPADKATFEEENDAWMLQGFYTFRGKDNRPTFTPIIRFDSYERNDGVDQYDELTLNATYFFTENIKGYIEYWDQLDVPEGQKEDSRVTVQIVAAF